VIPRGKSTEGKETAKSKKRINAEDAEWSNSLPWGPIGVQTSLFYRLFSMTWRRKANCISASAGAGDVNAEFEGENAKLEWSVSLDGKKKKNETYKIVAVLSKIPEESAKPH
jgi:hypothetical protein